MERDQRVNDYKKVFVESPRFYISFFLSIYFSQDDRLSVKRKKGRGSKSWEYSYCAYNYENEPFSKDFYEDIREYSDNESWLNNVSWTKDL